MDRPEGVATWRIAGLPSTSTSTRTGARSRSHLVAVRLKDSAGTGAFDYERTQDVTLAPAQILVIDFDAEKGGITLQ